MNISILALSWGVVLGCVLLNSYGALIIKYEINKTGVIPFSSIGVVICILLNYFNFL